MRGLGPDDLLPGEVRLATELGIARMTLRRALGRLEEEGRIVRRRGEGTRIRIPETGEAQASAMASVAQLLRIGEATGRRSISISDQAADQETARGLQVSQGTIVRRAELVRTLDGAAVSHLAAYFLRHPGMRALSAAQLAREPLLVITERLCGPVDRVEQWVGAVLADGVLVDALSVEPGEPLMRVMRWFWGGGQVRQFSIAHYRSDVFAMRISEDRNKDKPTASERWSVDFTLGQHDW